MCVRDRSVDWVSKMAAVVLKDTLEKRGKTAQSWSKRSVTLRQDALEYTHRFVWKTAILDLRDIVEVSEQYVSALCVVCIYTLLL